MFKVCIMSDTWFPIIGGGPKVAWEVAKRLTADFSCQVDIITRRFPNQKIQTLPKNLKIIYLGPRLPWNNNFSRLIFILLSFKYLLGKKYDIVHAFPFVAGFPVLAASHFNKTPTIFSVFALNTNNLLLNISWGKSMTLFMPSHLLPVFQYWLLATSIKHPLFFLYSHLILIIFLRSS